MDPEDASKRLGELVALAAAGPGPLREAIGKLDGDAGELLLAAVMLLATVGASVRFGLADADEREPEQSPGADDEEMPADPLVDPARPYSSTLDVIRQLRMALLDQPDLPALLRAVGALSADERELIVLELALEAWWTRTLEGGAE